MLPAQELLDVGQDTPDTHISTGGGREEQLSQGETMNIGMSLSPATVDPGQALGHIGAVGHLPSQEERTVPQVGRGHLRHHLHRDRGGLRTREKIIEYEYLTKPTFDTGAEGRGPQQAAHINLDMSSSATGTSAIDRKKTLEIREEE